MNFIKTFLWDFVFNFIDSILFNLMKWFYLNAPRWLLGEEGRSSIDICSGLMGVGSEHFLSAAGQTMCQEKIDNIVLGRTTVLKAAMITVCMTHGIPCIYAWVVKYRGRQKRREMAEKRRETTLVNKELIKFAQKIALIIKMRGVVKESKYNAILDEFQSMDDKAIQKMKVITKKEVEDESKLADDEDILLLEN